MPLAPICLFVYQRLDALQRTVNSLLLNDECKSSDLYIFSDAAATPQSQLAVENVRDYVTSIGGFRSIYIEQSVTNIGLANSIIRGVTVVLHRYGRVIVLEDDLVVSSNFLSFMNAALEFYVDEKKVFSISGYSSPMKDMKSEDVYFTLRGSSWGWATWLDRWEQVDWTVKQFEKFNKDKSRQKEFNSMGSDLTGMLRKQVNGTINSWAIRWVFHQFGLKLYTVFPKKSKVVNEGFGEGASHTSASNSARFRTELDTSDRKQFSFPAYPYLDPDSIHQFVAPYSLMTRAVYKIRTLLYDKY